MSTPGQPLRFIWCQDDWPLKDPCFFGYLFIEDGSFHVDEGASAQIRAARPGIEIPFIIISEDDVTAVNVEAQIAECEFWCTAANDCCSIDGPLNIDTHGYNWGCQSYLYYDPPFTGSTIYPHKTYSLCPHEEP